MKEQRMETNQILCGDCIEILKEIPDNCVDAVVTSPPYNKTGYRDGHIDTSKTTGKFYRWGKSKIDYDAYSDNISETKYQAWQVCVLDECYRILKPSGSVFYNHKVRRYQNKVSHPVLWCDKSKLLLYQQIIWNRQGSCDNNTAYCTPITELIFWLVKSLPVVYKDQAQYKSEVWTFPPAINSSHPAPYPLDLPQNCIQLSTKQDMVVLDPFCGSGTTCVAAKMLGRNYIGIDISSDYCRIARQRLEAVDTGVPVKEQRIGQMALFENKDV